MLRVRPRRLCEAAEEEGMARTRSRTEEKEEDGEGEESEDREEGGGLSGRMRSSRAEAKKEEMKKGEEE
eukprot:2448649-Rhodomonas_salina.3